MSLMNICKALDIPFVETMLHWSAGPKPYDGVWAPHWYNAVHASTGFDAPEDALPVLPDTYRPLLDAALPYYEQLVGHVAAVNGSTP